MMQPANEPTDQITNLGRPTRIFRPPRARITLALLVFGIMGTASLRVYFFPGRNKKPEPDFLVRPAIMFTLVGGILVFALRNRGKRIAVCPGGLLLKQRGEIEAWPWAEIVRVREQEAKDRVFFLKVGTYRAATVERSDGASFFIDRNRIAKAGELIDLIMKRVWERRNAGRIDDPNLAQIIDAWPSLSADVRTQMTELIDASQNKEPEWRGPSQSIDQEVQSDES
jgi:hypothetical protein